jgi:hypothetical protein
VILICVSLLASTISAEEKNPYMGAPVQMCKAPNGAITRQKLLYGIEKVGWLKPTIEESAKGVKGKALNNPSPILKKFGGEYAILEKAAYYCCCYVGCQLHCWSDLE